METTRRCGRGLGQGEGELVTRVGQMENIKDRAALLGYDVWIAPRSSLVLQVSRGSSSSACLCLLTACYSVAALRLGPP